jgi:hypothetical protein
LARCRRSAVAAISLAPLLLRLVDKTVRHVMRFADDDALARPELSIQAAMLDRGLRAGIVILAVLFLARMWDIDLIELTGRDTVAVRLLRGLVERGRDHHRRREAVEHRENR